MKESQIHLCGETLLLLGSRACFWPREAMLLLADWHLGKDAYFRASGYAMPSTIEHEMKRLEALIGAYQPKSVGFLGDVFHSRQEYGHSQFFDFTQSYPTIHFYYITGNHDPETTERSIPNLSYHKSIEAAPFLLIHGDRLPTDNKLFTIYGHIHPKIRVPMGMRTSQLFPAAVIGAHDLCLPAFGTFTGGHEIPLNSDETYYFFADGEVYHFDKGSC